MKAIYLQSLSSFFRSPFKLVSLALFLFILNLFLWVIPTSSILAYGFADLSALFGTIPYILMVFIASLFMSFTVDDYDKKLSDIIFSKPITYRNYWAGHFISGVTIVLIFLLLTLSSYFCLFALSGGEGVIDNLQIFTSYLGVFLLGLVFASISTFTASISRTQAGAFLLSILMCYAFFSLPALISKIPGFSGTLDYILNYISLDSHLTTLSRGILELKTLIYFGSLVLFFSFLSIQNVERKFR